MKSLISLIISAALVASGYSQTRNVLVNSNNAVVQPTNFWSVDASNARTGLGLGTAATNPASAFQPSSGVLSNLASSNAVNLTNLRATNIVGTIPASNISSLSLTNISGTLAISNGGSGATTAGEARTNFGLGNISTNTFQATNTAVYVNTNLVATNGTLTSTNIQSDYIESPYFLVGDSTNGIVFETTNIAAITRTNLGIGAGATNTVGFGKIRLGAGLIIEEPANDGAIIAFPNDTDPVVLGAAYWDHGSVRQSLGFSTNLSNFWTSTSIAAGRTNLGLPLAALTNTNNANFLAAFFGANTNPVLVNTNGEVVSPTNFWQAAPINTVLQNITNVVGNATNAATNARMLFLYSLAPTVTNVTSTITLPTNGSTFGGDVATITHLGPTSSVTAIRALGASTNIITLNQIEESVRFIYRDNHWKLMDNISYIEPIFFSGTNAAANAAASRTNLGGTTIGNAVFTATNAATAAAAIELGETNNVTFRNLTLDGGTNATTDEVNLNMLSANGQWSLFSIPTSDAPPASDVGGDLRQGSLWLYDNRLYQKIGGTSSSDNEWGKLLYLDGDGGATNARSGLGLAVTNNVTFSNVTASGTLTATSTVTAKTNLVVEGFVNYTAARTNNTPTNTPNFAAHAAWIEVKVGTNSFFLPAYQ